MGEEEEEEEEEERAWAGRVTLLDGGGRRSKGEERSLSRRNELGHGGIFFNATCWFNCVAVEPLAAQPCKKVEKS